MTTKEAKDKILSLIEELDNSFTPFLTDHIKLELLELTDPKTVVSLDMVESYLAFIAKLILIFDQAFEKDFTWVRRLYISLREWEATLIEVNRLLGLKDYE